jgi:RNA polymerase sigma factor (sigma-70 family)
MRALTKLMETDTTAYTERLEQLRNSGDAGLRDLLLQDDQMAATVIVERYHRFIGSEALKLIDRYPRSRRASIQELKQIGLITFLHYAKRWNPDGNAKLMTYAGQNAKWKMRDWLVSEDYVVPIPNIVGDRLTTLAGINSSRAAKGKAPLRDKEVARTFKPPLSLGSVQDLRQAARLTRYMGSLDEGFSPRTLAWWRDPYFLEDSKKVVSVTAEEPIGNEVENTATAPARKAAVREALATLSEREAQALRMLYGFDDGQPKTLDEIGAAFGITRDRVRQIEREAMKKLRNPSRSDALRDFLE